MSCRWVSTKTMEEFPTGIKSTVFSLAIRTAASPRSPVHSTDNWNSNVVGACSSNTRTGKGASTETLTNRSAMVAASDADKKAPW